MTREEEIKQAYYSEKKRCESEMLHRKSFEKGAQWADAHSRDEETEELKSSYHDMFCILANKVEQLRNPWISVEEHPDDVTKDYLLEYEDGSHIVAIWDSGMWMSKNLHPLKEPIHWMPIPQFEKGK